MDLELGLDSDVEIDERDKRLVQMYAPVYNGLAAGLAFGRSLLCLHLENV